VLSQDVLNIYLILRGSEFSFSGLKRDECTTKLWEIQDASMKPSSLRKVKLLKDIVYSSKLNMAENPK
jgi:hypothetical protein